MRARGRRTMGSVKPKQRTTKMAAPKTEPSANNGSVAVAIYALSLASRNLYFALLRETDPVWLRHGSDVLDVMRTIVNFSLVEGDVLLFPKEKDVAFAKIVKMARVFIGEAHPHERSKAETAYTNVRTYASVVVPQRALAEAVAQVFEYIWLMERSTFKVRAPDPRSPEGAAVLAQSMRSLGRMRDNGPKAIVDAVLRSIGDESRYGTAERQRVSRAHKAKRKRRGDNTQ